MKSEIQKIEHGALQQAVQQQTSAGVEETGILQGHIHFFMSNIWLIIGLCLATVLLGTAYVFFAKPVYRATISVQVEEVPSTHEISNLSKAFDLKAAAAPEMEVLRSRMVVARVVDNTKHYIEVEPKYFPLIGEGIARRNKQLSNSHLTSLGGYVWGADHANVTIFNVPPALEGKEFTLTVGENGGFRLEQKDEEIFSTGRVGQNITFQSKQGVIEIYVASLAATPGVKFRITRAARLSSIEALQAALKISERGKQSGVVSVSLDGSDAKSVTTLLNELSTEYLRQNEERRANAADKSLAFLDRQLPELKRELEKSEEEYNRIRHQHGVVDMSDDAKSLLQRSVAASITMHELERKKQELSTRYSNAHPEVIAINNQLTTTRREINKIDSKIKTIPEIEQDVLRLSRDVKVNTDVYTAVLSTARQLRLVSGSNVGNVRLLDPPEQPVKPIWPDRPQVLALSGFLGLILGVVVALFRKNMYARVHHPSDIRQLIGLPISAAITHSNRVKRLPIPTSTQRPAFAKQDLASDATLESLRRFRNALQHDNRQIRNNIILITGPSPSVGKSFVSANFAMVLASIGKRVLLIDADFRTGHLHRYFGLERAEGLSELIVKHKTPDKVISQNVANNVDFVSTGSPPPNPSELLSDPNLGAILESISTDYDYVLIDTAPVLAASDALMIAPHAGRTYFIVRSGVTTVSEIEEAIRQTSEAGVEITGVVLNDYKYRNAHQGYGASYGERTKIA